MLFEKVFCWMNELYQKHQKTRPLFIIFNAPQGAGKTTLCKQLESAFGKRDLNCVSISIDDFYLTRKEQIEIASKHPDNIYLQERGYPGTHDIELGKKILAELSATVDKKISIPVYDKSFQNGLGDRKQKSDWRSCQLPVDILILEGWMLGFPYIKKMDPHHPLFSSNLLLKDYSVWLDHFDGFLRLFPQSIEYIKSWRIQAEENQRKQGKPAMTNEHVTSYIEKFIPAYELYLPLLEEESKNYKNYLSFELDKKRNII